MKALLDLLKPDLLIGSFGGLGPSSGFRPADEPCLTTLTTQ